MAKLPGTYMWVFNGAQSRFPSGVFTSIEKAEELIARYSMTGILTAYPVDELVYEWAIENSLFEPKKDRDRTSEFIQGFTTASQEHYHYENGVRG